MREGYGMRDFDPMRNAGSGSEMRESAIRQEGTAGGVLGSSVLSASRIALSRMPHSNPESRIALSRIPHSNPASRIGLNLPTHFSPLVPNPPAALVSCCHAPDR